MIIRPISTTMEYALGLVRSAEMRVMAAAGTTFRLNDEGVFDRRAMLRLAQREREIAVELVRREAARTGLILNIVA